MKIATYNIWDDNRGMPGRMEQIHAQIQSLGADILCLQDVPSDILCKALAQKGGFDYSFHSPFPGSCDLAILSRFPLVSAHNIADSQVVAVDIGGVTLEVINVHLPWNHVLVRERHAVKLVGQNKKTSAHYSLLCGDFNCEDGCSVINFLLGRQSLFAEEAVPYWNDLAITHQNLTGEAPEATLDLATNPRWQGKGYHPGSGNRADRIFLKDTYPMPEPRLNAFGLFGKEVSPVTGFCASDHYGVYACLDFENAISTL